MVSPQSFAVADVGCDHAYVSIALIKRGLTKHVIAMDVKKGPLEIARANVAGQQLEGQIELRMGDGLEGLVPGEVDTIILAGMGGLLMKRILEEGRGLLENSEKQPCLILQPQSDLAEIRILVEKLSYHIVRETMLVEDDKYYTVIKALPGSELNYNEVELFYGKYNLEGRNEVLLSYLKKEWETLCIIEEQLNAAINEGSVSCRSLARREQVKEQKKVNELARRYYGEG